MAKKERIRKTFIDTTDLDLAHQEIGYLKDLCDAKDNVIAYQKELMNIQSESLKSYRLIDEAYRKLLEEHHELEKRLEVLENETNTKGKSVRLSKSKQDNN
jgi:hypothetical protein